MTTSTGIITVRYGIITENALPYPAVTDFRIDNTDAGVYFVGAGNAIMRSFVPMTGSSIIPLDFQTAYFGMRDNQRMTVNKLVAYIRFYGSAPFPLTLSWNWQTQDQMGTDTATVAPGCNTDGYARYEWNPPHASVTAGSFGFVASSNSEKLAIYELVAYYNPEADANLPISNKAS
jgi:hypothetical protein